MFLMIFMLNRKKKKVNIHFITTDTLKENKMKSCSLFRIVVVLLFYVHGKHLWSCRDGQLT